MLSFFLAFAPAWAEERQDSFYAGMAMVGIAHAVDTGSNNANDLDGGAALSAGIFAGYRHHLHKGLFVAGEAFYNHVDIEETASNGDRVDIGAHYGLKTHLGYSWTDWSLYGIAGLAAFDYSTRQANQLHENDDIVPLFGIGADYRFNKNWAVTTEITGTSDNFDTNTGNGGSIGLYTGQVGLRYHF